MSTTGMRCDLLTGTLGLRGDVFRMQAQCGGLKVRGHEGFMPRQGQSANKRLSTGRCLVGYAPLLMKADIHPKYVEAEIRCACGNVIKTRSTKATILIGICNVCHPFYTGQQKFVDTAGRVDKFQQRLAKTQAAQAAAVAAAATKKKKK